MNYLKNLFSGRWALLKVLLIGMLFIVAGGLLSMVSSLALVGAIVFFIGLLICLVGGVLLWPL
jgi:hypothetical protein